MVMQRVFVPFFKWLFLPVILQRASRCKGTPANDNAPSPGVEDGSILFLHGRGEYRYESVKTAHYQDELRTIAQRMSRADGPHECIAELILDDQNAKDRNCVVVAIDNTITGVFPYSLSTQYREWLERWRLSNAVVKCRAMIVKAGGHARSARVDYRVKLDIEVPFRMTVG
jgi:hypothetical protein